MLLRIQNYISATTIRDVGVLRNDLLSALTSAGLVQLGQRSTAPELNAHAGEPALLKALLLAALYPHVARVALPRNAVKFSRIASGTVAREADAHEWRATDMRGARVWVHPASMLFAETRWRSGIVVSFERVETANNNNNSNRNNKVYLRDVTEVRPKTLSFVTEIGEIKKKRNADSRSRCTPCCYLEGISPSIMCVAG